jgi:HEPN domain-containing protein
MSESEARRWLQFAKEDLETAELLLRESRPPRLVAFHAEQAAEKALKAAIVASGGEVVRTHDLNELRLLIPTTYDIAETDADLALLSQLAVEPRYPDTAAAITDSIAEKGVDDARTLVGAAERDVEREEGAP